MVSANQKIEMSEFFKRFLAYSKKILTYSPASKFFGLLTITHDAALPSLIKLADELNNQTITDWQWLLCTNGKSREIRKFVKQQNNDKISLLEAPCKRTPNFALLLENIWFRRDFCIKHVRSRYLIMMDSDIKILNNDFLATLKKAIETKPEEKLFLYNIQHRAAGIIPIFPIEYGRIDIANYCCEASLAKEVGYPQHIDWQKIKNGARLEHKDYHFFISLMQNNEHSFHYINTEPFLEWNGNASYKSISSGEGDMV